MKRYFIFLFLITCAVSRAQNLVPNPSFEEYTTCPNNGGQLEYALYWTNPLAGGGSSPDYLNVCGIPSWNVPSNGYGYEPARSGVAYAAIFIARYNPFNPSVNNGREYLQVELLDTLKANIDYCFKFYVSACDSMHYVSNNIGIYFSPTEVRDTCYNFIACGLQYTPQFENDSTNDLSSRDGWTEVSGIYKASGGEKYIVIGNFRDTTTTVATYVGWSSIPNFAYAAYYIDDVYLSPCDTLTNIVESWGALNIGVYPNPTDGYFFINSANEPIMKTEIFDSSGKLIYDENFSLQHNIAIDIRNMISNFYLLSVTTPRNKYFFKLLKS
jgi:hypothetical protein